VVLSATVANRSKNTVSVGQNASYCEMQAIASVSKCNRMQN
jgi:hypothetical protein